MSQGKHRLPEHGITWPIANITDVRGQCMHDTHTFTGAGYVTRSIHLQRLETMSYTYHILVSVFSGYAGLM
jgi:hypothetical protein